MDEFRYDFTTNELIYFLFKKKVCPQCGKKLVRVKDFEMKSGSDFVSKRGYFLPHNAEVKHYLYRYICQQCGRSYELKELAGAN